jgi:hypothetical protein
VSSIDAELYASLSSEAIENTSVKGNVSDPDQQQWSVSVECSAIQRHMDELVDQLNKPTYFCDKGPVACFEPSYSVLERHRFELPSLLPPPLPGTNTAMAAETAVLANRPVASRNVYIRPGFSLPDPIATTQSPSYSAAGYGTCTQVARAPDKRASSHPSYHSVHAHLSAQLDCGQSEKNFLMMAQVARNLASRICDSGEKGEEGCKVALPSASAAAATAAEKTAAAEQAAAEEQQPEKVEEEEEDDEEEDEEDEEDVEKEVEDVEVEEFYGIGFWHAPAAPPPVRAVWAAAQAKAQHVFAEAAPAAASSSSSSSSSSSKTEEEKGGGGGVGEVAWTQGADNRLLEAFRCISLSGSTGDGVRMESKNSKSKSKSKRAARAAKNMRWNQIARLGGCSNRTTNVCIAIHRY